MDIYKYISPMIVYIIHHIIIIVKHFLLFANGELTKLARLCIIMILSALSAGKEVESVEYILSFVMSVMARIVGYYAFKWLDRRKSDK